MPSVNLKNAVKLDHYHQYEYIRAAISKLSEGDFDFSLYKIDLFDEGDFIAIAYTYIFRKPGTRGSADPVYKDYSLFVEIHNMKMTITLQR